MKQRKNYFLIALFATLWLSSATILAQQPFCYDDTPSSRDLTEGCRRLALQVDAAGFFFDAEYSAPTAEGYTVTGFSLSPELVYGINERAQVRVGFQATLFAGLDSLYHLRPTLTLLYQPHPWLTLVAGTLTGAHRQQLDYPIEDPSRSIYHPTEEGLEIMTRTSRWRSDTWLDWHHYLTPYTPDQEHFTMGTLHEIAIIGKNSQRDNSVPFRQWRLSMPLLFMARHRGGEVKTIDTNTVTTFNESLALRLLYRWGNNVRGLNHQLTLNLPVLFYSLEDNELDNGGKALYPTLSYNLTTVNKNELSALSVSAKVGFWHGDHFFSSQGSPLFWSVNSYTALHIPQSTAGINADVRNIITASLALGHQFKSLNIGLQVDALHDTDLSKTDFIFSFVMRFNELFFVL